MALTTALPSQLSATDLTIRPGISVATFDVEVVNGGDRHASFYILLTATGEENQNPRHWYQLSPMASSKVPPGTRSTYTVSIVDTPLSGFVGLATVTVRIISPELQSEERHILRLRIEPGQGGVPFRVELPTETFQDYPGQLVEIPARIYNSNRNPISVNLACPGIHSWLLDNHPTILRLLPNRWHDVVFPCQIPEAFSLSQSQSYPFKVLVVDESGDSVSASGTLEILPLGYFEAIAEDTTVWLPARRPWWPNRQLNTTQTHLQIQNHSNLTSPVRVSTVPPKTPSQTEPPPYDVECTPETVTLAPAEAETIAVNIQRDRPWLGWARARWIDLQARLDDTRLELRNDTVTVQVRVAPIIPYWLQVLALALFSGTIAGILFFQVYRQQHHQLVSSVEFNGVGDRIVSGSSDQTLRQWQVRRWGLRPLHSTIRLDKAVRVAQYRPVDNDQLMVGLENGEVQIWNLLQFPQRPLFRLINPTKPHGNLDDRVMALTTTADSRHLFSGHGSGLVNHWDIGRDQTAEEPPRQAIAIPDMAIYDMALVKDDAMLAIGGRYNKLMLWNWSASVEGNNNLKRINPLSQAETGVRSIAYPPGGQDDYITSLATAEQKPLWLATADNQGRITVWNLEQCWNGQDECVAIDQWEIPSNTPIRDIAWSANGCYLTSADDDGRITLWPLTQRGRRLTKYLDGKTVMKANTQFNSVDIKAVRDQLFITSGADDHRVRIRRIAEPSESCQS